MKELNIGNVLGERRREKGVTQEEVAAFVGVSKASVSKWENGQSYPDITVLPVLASFFHITIDELLGYRPQLTEKEIWESYRYFTRCFGEEPFCDVMEKVRALIRKYDACYPLFLAMAQLLFNHWNLAASIEEGFLVLKEAQELCVRVQRESEDTLLKKDAIALEGFLAVMKREPERVLELFGEKLRPRISSEILLVSAYGLLGEKKRALKYCQALLYESAVEMMDLLANYLALCGEDKKELCFSAVHGMEAAFSLKNLLPHKIINLYMMEAIYYGEQKNREKTMTSLLDYVETVRKNWKDFTIHGDAFFDLLEEWLKETGISRQMPRNMQFVREQIIRSVQENPVFDFLKEEKEFRILIKKLENLQTEERD